MYAHRTWIPLGLALAVLFVVACTPPAMDESDVESTNAIESNEGEDVSLVESSDFQNQLQRLGELSLAANCGNGLTSYRFLKLDTDERVAAVRISWDAEKGAYGGAYRSVFSSSSTMAVFSDGFVDERMWKRIESEFGYSDFWNLESERSVAASGEPSFFLEACKDGEYHWLQRRLSDTWLARIVRIFSTVGKLEWLETGR